MQPSDLPRHTAIAPFGRPIYIMAKPAGPLCNMACDYCYYLEKKQLYKHEPRQMMSDEVLELFVRDYIAAAGTPEVLFTWHGGEALMRPISFYRRVVELQEKYAAGHVIDNCIQTNGTLLTDEWCRFFAENRWLVGVSIDGPQDVHDAYRRTRLCRPTFRQVMRGIAMLNRHGVEWNALAVVNDLNAEQPLRFYRFFKEIGCSYLQFTPIVERILPHPDGRTLAAADESGKAQLTPFSVKPADWGSFLCAIFDEWVRYDVGRQFVQLFDATLAGWMGVPPGICTLAETCGHAGVMEFNGDVYSCDHFVFPHHLLGNIREQSLHQMMHSERQQHFGRAKRDALPKQCRECRWLFACHGECPKNRFCRTADGQPGLNYLCEGYRMFFEHTAPYMDFMRRELLADRAPAGVMEAIRRGEL